MDVLNVFSIENRIVYRYKNIIWLFWTFLGGIDMALLVELREGTAKKAPLDSRIYSELDALFSQLSLENCFFDENQYGIQWNTIWIY